MKDQDQIVKELETIAKRNDGELTPDGIVRFAKNKATALHSHFTWDDTEAAHQYRLYQARGIVARLRLDVERKNIMIRIPFAVRNPALTPSIQGYSILSEIHEAKDASAVFRQSIGRAIAALKNADKVGLAVGIDASEQIRGIVAELERMSEQPKARAAG